MLMNCKSSLIGIGSEEERFIILRIVWQMFLKEGLNITEWIYCTKRIREQWIM
jgi:hypothetical protein